MTENEYGVNRLIDGLDFAVRASQECLAYACRALATFLKESSEGARCMHGRPGRP
jgi:hypothetical protein